MFMSCSFQADPLLVKLSSKTLLLPSWGPRRGHISPMKGTRRVLVLLYRGLIHIILVDALQKSLFGGLGKLGVPVNKCYREYIGVL